MKCSVILCVFLVSLAVPNEASLLSRADSLANAKAQLQAMLKAGEAAHENLRAATSEFAEKIKATQKNTLAMMQEASANVCSEGLSQSSLALAKGSECMMKAAAEGVLEQGLTQMHCFKKMAEYVVRFGVLGYDLAKCTVNVKCHGDVMSAAVMEEVENHELVSQKLNHIWEAGNTLDEMTRGCMMGFAGEMQEVQRTCDAANN